MGPQMHSHFISLEGLYRFVSEHPTNAALLPNSPERRRLFRLAADLTSSIPEEPGFYLWGRFETNRLWRNVYLGKSGRGRTASLRARVREELKDEAAFLWAPVLSGRVIRAGCPDRYGASTDRALRKTGCSHIVWFADPALADIDIPDIEADLIETMAPGANVIRPTPPPEPQDYTHQVVGHFRRQVHDARKDGFPPAGHFLQRIGVGA